MLELSRDGQLLRLQTPGADGSDGAERDENSLPEMPSNGNAVLQESERASLYHSLCPTQSIESTRRTIMKRLLATLACPYSEAILRARKQDRRLRRISERVRRIIRRNDMKRLTHHHSPSHHLRGLTNMIVLIIACITLTGCCSWFDAFRYGGPGGDQSIGRPEEPAPDVRWLKEAKRGEASNEQANGRGSALGAKGISRSGGNVESVQRSDDADRGRSKGDGRISASTPQRSGEEVKEARDVLPEDALRGEPSGRGVWHADGSSAGDIADMGARDVQEVPRREIAPGDRIRAGASEPTDVTDAELASSHIDGRFAAKYTDIYRDIDGGRFLLFTSVRGYRSYTDYLNSLSARNQIHGNGLRLDVSEIDRLIAREGKRGGFDPKALTSAQRHEILKRIIERGQ